jgi:hypothetical protein
MKKASTRSSRAVARAGAPQKTSIHRAPPSKEHSGDIEDPQEEVKSQAAFVRKSRGRLVKKGAKESLGYASVVEISYSQVKLADA